MITKEKLTGIVRKSVEDAWYNRRSLNPVKEQTEIIVNGIMEQLNKPAVSKCEDIEREATCKHSDWIDLYYDSGDWYGRYCKDCGEFFE